MCLATPGVILAITTAGPAGADDPLWRSAEVDFGGVRQRVSLACLPEARVGDRVLVHVGVALSLVHDDDHDDRPDHHDDHLHDPSGPHPLPPSATLELC
jgi:hydrogenase expression/formation protein HypC